MVARRWLTGVVRGVQLGVEFRDAGVGISDLLVEQEEHLFGHRWNVRLLFNGREQHVDFYGTFGGDDAELQHDYEPC